MRVPLSLRLQRRRLSLSPSLHLLLFHGYQVPGVPLFGTHISGPLLDRIDIHIEVPRVEYEKLSDTRIGEDSAAIQVRVEVAREIQSSYG